MTSVRGKVFSWSGNIAHRDDEEVVSQAVNVGSVRSSLTLDQIIENLEPYNEIAKSGLVERLEKVLPQLRHGYLQSLGLPDTYVRVEKHFVVHETVDIEGVGPVLRLIYQNIDVRIGKGPCG